MYCLLFSGLSMERRKIDLPDYERRRKRAELAWIIFNSIEHLERTLLPYSIGYALPFGVDRELRGLPSSGDGRRG